MKWIVWIEIALTVLLFAASLYSPSRLTIGLAALMVIVTLLTLAGAWGWTATFRG